MEWGHKDLFCSWKGIYQAVCPEACCEMLVRHWLNTTHKIPKQKPLYIYLAGTMVNFGFFIQELHDNLNLTPVSRFSNLLKQVIVYCKHQSYAPFRTELECITCRISLNFKSLFLSLQFNFNWFCFLWGVANSNSNTGFKIKPVLLL